METQKQVYLFFLGKEAWQHRIRLARCIAEGARATGCHLRWFEVATPEEVGLAAYVLGHIGDGNRCAVAIFGATDEPQFKQVRDLALQLPLAA